MGKGAKLRNLYQVQLDLSLVGGLEHQFFRGVAQPPTSSVQVQLVNLDILAISASLFVGVVDL